MAQTSEANALSRRKFLRTAGLSGTALVPGFLFSALAAKAGQDHFRSGIEQCRVRN